MLLCLLLACCGCASGQEGLPGLNANLAATSVSGLSSGGYFAVQMHVAYSSIMVGAGIFAGGPYNCAQGSSTEALTTCMAGTPKPNVATYIDETLERASQGDVDDVKNLEGQQVYLFSGTLDTTVDPTVMDALQSYYSYFLASNATNQLQYENTIRAAHTQPTDIEPNNPCDQSKTPFISFCDYDGAGAALNHIYGDLNPKATGVLSGSVMQFDQSQYIPAGQTTTSTSLDEYGYVYIPEQCAAGENCVVHVAFHGCEQGATWVGSDYVMDTGYLQWADTNNIIVLFPQADKSVALGNPYGCWNWWGYAKNPTTYDTKDGYQMQAVYAMLLQLTSNFSDLPVPEQPTIEAITNTSVTFSWPATEDATGYNVWQSGSLLIGTTEDTSFTAEGLAPGTTYSFSVSALFSLDEESAASEALVVTTPGTPPPLAAPTDLQVTSTNSYSVSLEWSPVTGAEAYEVYRNGAMVGATSDTFYTDKGLEPATTYHYQVAAYSEGAGSSPLSDSVAAVTTVDFDCQSYYTNNYQHVKAGRAYVELGICYATGSEEYIDRKSVV